MPKVTIGRLMAGIALFSLALATLRYPTNLGAACMATLAVGALAESIGRAAATRGEARAGAVGFAGACGLYLAVYAVGPPERGGWFGSPLLTTPLLDVAFSVLVDTPPPGINGIILGGTGPESVFQSWSMPDTTGVIPLQGSFSFRLAGHAIFAILVGWLGSWAARRRFRRFEQESTGG